MWSRFCEAARRALHRARDTQSADLTCRLIAAMNSLNLNKGSQGFTVDGAL
jgi:hypothetical protein